VNPPGSAGTLSSLQFKPALTALRELGIDVEPILSSCRLDLAQLDDPLMRFDAELEHRFWAAIEAQAGDPAIGLRVGVTHARLGRYDVGAYIMQHSGTLRRALQNIQPFTKLGDDRGHLQLLESSELASLRTFREGGYRRAAGFIDAMYAGAVTLFGEHITGFRLISVNFHRPRPRALRPYADVFGVTPVFEAEHNQITIDRRLLDVAVPSNPGLLNVLQEHATNLLRSLPEEDPLLSRVQRAIAHGFENGGSSLDQVARATGMSARTLRRRLASVGTSFQQVLDGLRRDLACYRLRRDDGTIAMIAERLGFASTSAFQRAFQRWTGQSPSAYREAQRHAG
jgi:AraC-like DNA-binding protein